MSPINNFSIKVSLSILLLLISSIAMLISIDQSKATSSNIQNTYTLLNLSKNIQAKSYDFKNAANEYLILSASERVKQRILLDQSHDYILNTLSLMQTLIANKPDQSKKLKVVKDTFLKVAFEFDNIQPKKGGLLIDGPRISILAEGSVSNLNATLQNQLREFDFLLQNSLKEQQQNAADKTLLAELMMLSSLIAGISLMLHTLFTLHREVRQRENNAQ